MILVNLASIKVSKMNVITIADIKRGGLKAIDAALSAPMAGGVVTLMNHHQPVAIVMAVSAYEALLANAATVVDLKPANTALEWLLAGRPPNTSALDADGIAQRLSEMRAGW
jgi:hypothetical protein